MKAPVPPSSQIRLRDSCIIGDVERVIASRVGRVVPSLGQDGVRDSSVHCHFRDEQPVEVPGDAPARVAYGENRVMHSSWIRCLSNIMRGGVLLFLQ